MKKSTEELFAQRRRDAEKSRKISLRILSSLRRCVSVRIILLIGVSGCVQTPYRYEVHDTGEGSVRVDRVPKDPSEIAAETPAPAPTPTEQQRIDALEAQVQQLSAENQKLKQAMPATVP